MKTSVKLLLALLLSLVVAMFGAAISIHRQLSKLDKTDSYAQWQKQALPAFQAIHITGPSAAIVQIEQGPATRLLANSLNDSDETTYTYRVEHDTLFLHLNPVADNSYLDYELNRWDDPTFEWHDPQLIVQAPLFTSVSTNGTRCQIHRLKGNKLTLNQQGKGGKTMLDKLELNQLNASLAGHSRLTIYGRANRIAQGIITVRDSAQLFQFNEFTQGLTITADPGAQLHLTGKALKQIQQ